MSDNCRWMDADTEICFNDRCPLCADYCPVVYVPEVCRHEERTGDGNILAMRKKLGMKQKEFAELCGVSQTCVSWWENGKHVPPYEHIKAVVEAETRRRNNGL